MGRTPGALNKKRRKDFGKKRKLYAGKKTKPRKKTNGRFQTYESKRKKGQPIKVAFWKIDIMHQESYMNFSSKVRRYMQKKVYGRGAGRVYVEVEPSVLSSKENISELCLNLNNSGIMWEGEWLLLMCSHTKNKHHVSYKATGRVVLKDHPDRMTCKVYPTYTNRKGGTRSLRRYWFWRDE